MHILDISCLYQDSAAWFVEDGNVLAAAQEERFTLKKPDARFPKNAIRYCLDVRWVGRLLLTLDMSTLDANTCVYKRLVSAFPLDLNRQCRLLRTNSERR